MSESEYVQPVIHDVSLSISSQTVVFPGDSVPHIRRISDIQLGDPLTHSQLSIGCHVGTHIDAPSHFLAEKWSLNQLPLESFYGPAIVFNMQNKSRVEKSDIDSLNLPYHHHLLFKTDNSSLLQTQKFHSSYCTLSQEAAEFLCQGKPLSIGWDYYSLDPSEANDFWAHKRFAVHNVPVFVCLDLFHIHPGVYHFVGLPLRLESVEASPVRALLIEEHL
jgi:arylformamidase